MDPTSIQSTIKTRKVRAIRRKKDWQRLLTEYAASELSQKAFCELHQLSMSSFYQWKKKLANETNETNFIDISHQFQAEPVVQIKSEKAPYQVELELGFGIILRVRSL